MQSASPNSLFGMLTDQKQASSSDAIWGIKPQMGRFLSSDPVDSESPSAFTNIFLQLQAGVSDDQAKALETYRLASVNDGNALPVEGQSLPLLNNLSHDLMADSLTDETNESAQFELSVQTGENEDGLNEIISAEQIGQAQSIASQLNKNVELNSQSDKEGSSIGLQASSLSSDAAADTQIPLEASENQSKVGLDENVADESASEFAAAYAHPLSGLDLNVKNKAPLKISTQDYSLKGAKAGLSLPLNLRPQAGTQLQESISTDENALDDPTLSAIKGTTLSVNDLKSDSTGALSNLNQLQSQSMQSLNVQAGQIQNSASLQMDANAKSELEQSIEQAEGEAELSVNEQINKLSNKQDSLYLGKQSQLWGKQLGDHITTLIKQDVQEAKIHLDPPELGSLEIKLQVQNQEAKVQIQVSQPQVRDVLEQQSARLREALAQEGMNLSGFDVSSGNQQQTGQQAQEQGSLFGEGELSGLEGESESSNAQMKATSVSVSLVDTFA